MTRAPLTSEAVAAALARHRRVERPSPPGRRSDLRCGVLVGICFAPEPTTVLTLRPASLSRHGGEVCFPGGRPEPQDRDLEATARREALEEIGVAPGAALGRLSSVPVFTSEHRLEPFVAELPRVPTAPVSGEVARVLAVSLPELLGRTCVLGLPVAVEGRSRLSPIFVLDGLVAFGATARALHELLEVLAPLCGRAVPPLEPGPFTWADLEEHGALAAVRRGG